MSAGLSAACKAALYAPNTGDLPLCLLTLDHDDWAQPVRLVNDRQDLVSNGDTYTARAFSVQLPADKDGPPRAVLVVDNVDRALVAAMRTITTPPTVSIGLVLRSAPNTIERTWPNLRIRSAQIHATALEVELGPNAVFDEGYPGLDFTPLAFPAGFDR